MDRTTYATVSWTPMDVVDLLEQRGITIKPSDAATFLVNNERHIRDRLIELGWGVIDTLISLDDDLQAVIRTVRR